MPSVFAKAKLLVRWSNVTINADRKLVKGWVEAVYDESSSQVADLDDIFEGGARFGTVEQGITKAAVDLDFTLSDGATIAFNPDDGTITIGDNVVDISHIIEEKELTGEGAGSIFPITVKDAAGSIYQLDETGEVDEDGNPILSATLIGKERSPIAPGAVDFENIAADKAVVTFEKAGTYAFDTWITQYAGKQLIRDKYEALNDGYSVPFKLLPTGKTDVVKAKIQAVDGGINPGEVLFKTPMGTEFAYTYDEESNSYTITLTGGVAGDGQEVYALYPNGDGSYLNLGKLVVLSYPEQTYSLVAVSVNNAGVDVAALSSKLNEIYNPFGISWTVTADTCTYTGSTQLMEQGSSLLSAYTDAMKAFQSEYSARRNIDSKTAYLFFFNQYGAGATTNRNADGFMPRNKQLGYLFTQGFAGTDELYAAAAHELGHGMFVLKHTFDSDYQLPEGSTDNLMDYTVGATHLAKWQWDLIHDPGVVVRVFEKDEDAMFAGGFVFTPDYKLIQVPNVSILFAYPEHKEQLRTGTLPGFVVYEGEERIMYSWDGKQYVNIDNPADIYPVSYSNPSRNSRVKLFYNLDFECGKKSYIDTTYIAILEVLNYDTQKKIQGIIDFINLNASRSKQLPCALSVTSEWNDGSQISLDCNASDIEEFLRPVIEKINNIPANASPFDVNQILQANYSTCLFQHIDIKTKIKLLNILLAEGVDDESWEFEDWEGPDQFFLGSLIVQTNKEDRLELLKAFMANNHLWLRVLWDETSNAILNNDVTLPNITILLSEIASWAIEYYDALDLSFTPEDFAVTEGLKVKLPVGTTPILLGGDGDSHIWETKNDYGMTIYEGLMSSEVEFLKTGKIQFKQERTVRIVGDKGTTTYGFDKHEPIVDPFEPVVLSIGNTYEFLGFPDNMKGQEIIVPAIYAAMCIQKVKKHDTEYIVRFIGDGVVIVVGVVAAPASGGSSLAAAAMIVAGGAAAIDIPIQYLRYSLQESNEYAEYRHLFELWDYVYHTSAMVDLGAGLAVSAPKLAQFAKSVEWTKQLRQFSVAIKHGASEVALHLKEILQNPKGYILYLKLNQQIAKGLVTETEFAKANKLFTTPLKQHEVVEYVLPKSAVSAADDGVYYIKASLKHDGSEVIVGQFAKTAENDVELIAYAEKYSDLTTATNITDDVLKVVVRSVAKNIVDENSLFVKLKQLNISNIEKLISNIKNAGDEGLKLAKRIELGIFDGVEGYITLINNATPDFTSLKAVNQALDKAEELTKIGIDKKLLIFEHNTQTGLHDIDLGIRKIDGTYAEVYQFKSNTEKLTNHSIQNACKQLMETKSDKRIVEFRLVKEDNLALIKSNEDILRQMTRYLYEKEGTLIDEIHLIFNNGEKIKVTYNNSLNFTDL